jgi:putative endonuclease
MEADKTKKNIGKLGEDLALKYLVSKKYSILDKNYIPQEILGRQIGEIDIIAQKDDQIVFFEVKTLSKNQNFYPEQKINQNKLAKIIKSAKYWLTKNKAKNWRIDVIALELDKERNKAIIRHYKNITAP